MNSVKPRMKLWQIVFLDLHYFINMRICVSILLYYSNMWVKRIQPKLKQNNNVPKELRNIFASSLQSTSITCIYPDLPKAGVQAVEG